MIHDIPMTTITVWGHRGRQADRWHVACQEFMSRRAENLVSRVAKCEDMRGGEVARRLGAIHLRRTGGRDREISRTQKFTG
jgi:hypothetical protein